MSYLFQKNPQRRGGAKLEEGTYEPCRSHIPVEPTWYRYDLISTGTSHTHDAEQNTYERLIRPKKDSRNNSILF
jgi:hypothetical protein